MVVREFFPYLAAIFVYRFHNYGQTCKVARTMKAGEETVTRLVKVAGLDKK